MECFEETQPVSWSFCISRVPASTNTDLIYYLHARNGNATWWNDRDYHTGRLYDRWEAQGKDPPIVASVSFGKLWMLSDYDPQITGGLFRVMIDTVLPTVEAAVGTRPARRMAAGISMGGFNALLLALKSDGLFSKVAAVCPPVPTVSHHDGIWRVLKARRETRTSHKRALMLWLFARRFYPTREIWEANDPLTLSRTFIARTGPALYLTCGRADDWGCLAGSERLAANIAQAGGDITWVPREGGHCDIDYASLAAFLQGAASPIDVHEDAYPWHQRQR
jgi:pimeloyl-ACP methyl ester carboxylesterase